MSGRNILGPAARWNRIAREPLSGQRRIASQRMFVMKTIATLLAVAALSLAAPSADAKGCLKGAVVGGVAGHYAGHHGVLGAAAGCLYGRHRAKEQDKEQDKQQQSQGGQAPAGQEKM
jgi:outer membrane lipoprotein SlyB